MPTLHAARIYATVKNCQDSLYDTVHDTGQDSAAIYGEARAARQSAMYECIGVEQRSIHGQEAEEQAIMRIFKSHERQTLHVEAQLTCMARHKGAYDAVFASWTGQAWMSELNAVHKSLKQTLQHSRADAKQPNPWMAKTNSKRYLVNLLEAYKGTATTSSVA